MKSYTVLIGGITGLLALTAAASVPTIAQADDLATIRERGFARGVTANEKPYGYIESDGTAAGIGPDVATAVLKKIGIEKIEWTVVAFDGLIPGVKANRFDFSAAEQAIRPARCQQVAFSVPTSSYTVGLLVKAGNPKNIRSLEDVAANPDVKLAQLAGAVELLADEYEIPRSSRVYIQAVADAIPALVAGRADAYIATELTIAGLAKLSSEVEVADLKSVPMLDGKPYRNYGAFTFRPEDKEFIGAFNAALVEFKVTDEYERILTSYGLTKPSVEAARSGSTEALCAAE
jgi:polar amino acid transport system substrate-binding protein